MRCTSTCTCNEQRAAAASSLQARMRLHIRGSDIPYYKDTLKIPWIPCTMHHAHLRLQINKRENCSVCTGAGRSHRIQARGELRIDRGVEPTRKQNTEFTFSTSKRENRSEASMPGASKGMRIYFPSARTCTTCEYETQQL